MKHWIACLPLFAALFLIGLRHGQPYSNPNPPPKKVHREHRLTISASDREAVKQVLTDIATKRHFEERTQLSAHFPKTICSFRPTRREVSHAHRGLGGKGSDFPSTCSRSRRKSRKPRLNVKLRDQIVSELQKQFRRPLDARPEDGASHRRASGHAMTSEPVLILKQAFNPVRLAGPEVVAVGVGESIPGGLAQVLRPSSRPPRIHPGETK